MMNLTSVLSATRCISSLMHSFIPFQTSHINVALALVSALLVYLHFYFFVTIILLEIVSPTSCSAKCLIN